MLRLLMFSQDNYIVFFNIKKLHLLDTTFMWWIMKTIIPGLYPKQQLPKTISQIIKPSFNQKSVSQGNQECC